MTAHRRHKIKIAHKGLKQVALAIILGAIATFFLLRTDYFRAYMEEKLNAPVATTKKQTGYRDKDRRALEKLIHEEGKHD